MSMTEPPRPPTPSPLPATSRYQGIDIATSTTPSGDEVRWFRRRFVPPPERLATSHDHIVVAGERLDIIANEELGDAELWWRLADANRAMRPSDLTAEPGTTLHVGLPEGFPGAPG